jgi:hypothetical protein
MSNHAFKQRARACIDRAVSRSFAELARPSTRLAFANLLNRVREKSSLLRPTGDGTQQLLALEALRNIARQHEQHLRCASLWDGGEASVHTLVHGLASHLFGRYAISRIFGQVWFGGNSLAEREVRRWFIAHARGCRFRDIPGLPIAMTRKMERLLLQSPHDLPLRPAMRRAEILALGGDPALVEIILATPLAHDLEHGDFWRSALHFFINHQAQLSAEQIASFVEFFYAIRIRPVEFTTADGRTRTRPLDPSFSLVGRTPSSVTKLLTEWKRESCRVNGLGRRWSSSGLPGMWWQDGEWQMFELLCSSALQNEGEAMYNCVGSYADACASGRSSIWSLRWRERTGNYVSRCTIEVNPASRKIVQIRGRGSAPLQLEQPMIEEWSAQAGLTIPRWAWYG